MSMDQLFHELSMELKSDTIDLMIKRLKEAGISDQLELSSVMITAGVHIIVDSLRSLPPKDRRQSIVTTAAFFELTMALLAEEL